MELPIAPQTYQASPLALIRTVRQADVMMMSASTEPVEIDGALVFINPKLPGVHMANCATQLHAPEGQSPHEVLRRVFDIFASQQQRCYWLQTAELDWSQAWQSAAMTCGYQPGPKAAVLRLNHWLPPSNEYIQKLTSVAGWQILPGRVVRHALRALFEQKSQSEDGASPALAQQLAQWHIARLDEPRCETLVARWDGQIVGYVSVVSVGAVGVIDDVYTMPSWRHRGVATALLEQALDLCARAQHESVVLESLVDGEAIGMYQRRGFVVIGEHRRYERLK